MFNSMELAKGARKIIEVCGNVKPNEKVLVVTDTGINSSIVEALAVAAKAVGAETAIITTSPGRSPGEEPSEMVASAMLGADVIISPTTRTIYHSKATADALANGARVLSLTEVSEKVLISGGIDADFIGLQSRIRKLQNILGNASKIHISTKQGTEMYFDVTGRPGYACNGLCHNPGDKLGIPEVEVFIAPIETYTHGQFVIDATIAGYGLVSSPVTVTVKKGRAVKFEGGNDAEVLERMIKSSNNINSFTIAEIGIGLNDCAKVIGEIIEDEGAYGTGHFAFGNNVYFGGKNEAPIHLDVVYWAPTIEADGEVVMEDGVLL